MNAIERLELAILGGGCAGLSLARELSMRHVKGRVIVFEPREIYNDDRSWCFWSTRQHQYSSFVSHTWPQWLFSRQGQSTQARDCDGYFYQYVRSADFYRHSLDAIAQCAAIKIKLGSSVTAVEPCQDGWHIITPEQTFFAAQVVDTRPPEKERVERSMLFQCFLGVEITLDTPNSLDPTQVELMTEMRIAGEDFCFTYILPFASDRLLVEVTFFSRRPLSQAAMQQELTALLVRRGWETARVLRTEHAHLPMGLPPTHTNDETQSHRYLHAGMRGGALRASSGYAFMRIQRWAERCAQQYCEHGNLSSQTGSSFWLQQMDHMFLTVINKQPCLAPIFFEKLLSIKNTERFLRFMDDRATLTDYLHVVASLPKTPFLKALASTAFKR